MAKTSKFDAVGLGAQDGALVRIGPARAALVDDVEADVADFPVDASVGTDREAGDAVAAERRDGRCSRR